MIWSFLTDITKLSYFYPVFISSCWLSNELPQTESSIIAILSLFNLKLTTKYILSIICSWNFNYIQLLMSTQGNNNIEMMANVVWSSIFSIPLLKNYAHCIQIIKFIRDITEDKISWSIWHITIIFMLFLYITGSFRTKIRPLHIVGRRLFYHQVTLMGTHYFHHKFSLLIPKNQNLHTFVSIYALNTLKYFFQ